MSDDTKLLLDNAERVFAGAIDSDCIRRAEDGEWLADVWDVVSEFGAPLMLLGENQGGFGLSPSDAFAVVRLAATHCVPLPIAETMLGNWMLAQAGLPPSDQPLTIVDPKNTNVVLEQRGGSWHASGTVSHVQWGRFADPVLVVDGYVVRLDRRQADITHGANLAGHPRDDLRLDVDLSEEVVGQAPEPSAPTVEQAGAAMRAAAIAGALDRVLDMTVAYANDRVQFGRPIAKFQAVQQNLARLAGVSVAANGAADLAADSFANGSRLVIAAAKARASEAAGEGASIAHQIFAAIGFTQEHSLNHYTRALWSWRDEFGSEAYWNRELGEAAANAGPEALWPMMTELA